MLNWLFWYQSSKKITFSWVDKNPIWIFEINKKKHIDTHKFKNILKALLKQSDLFLKLKPCSWECHFPCLYCRLHCAQPDPKEGPLVPIHDCHAELQSNLASGKDTSPQNFFLSLYYFFLLFFLYYFLFWNAAKGHTHTTMSLKIYIKLLVFKMENN